MSGCQCHCATVEVQTRIHFFFKEDEVTINFQPRKADPVVEDRNLDRAWSMAPEYVKAVVFYDLVVATTQELNEACHKVVCTSQPIRVSQAFTR
ncbi:TPA: hypothetical protein DF272_05940 [Candidatus Falkowbacteria bacterium]|nr:hypothetical protein [Candidatus Falkowbacteria bacterium]